MSKFIKERVGLHDDVAEAEATREKKRAEMVERMNTVGKGKVVSKSDSETASKSASK